MRIAEAIARGWAERLRSQLYAHGIVHAWDGRPDGVSRLAALLDKPRESIYMTDDHTIVMVDGEVIADGPTIALLK